MTAPRLGGGGYLARTAADLVLVPAVLSVDQTVRALDSMWQRLTVYPHADGAWGVGVFAEPRGRHGGPAVAAVVGPWALVAEVHPLPPPVPARRSSATPRDLRAAA